MFLWFFGITYEPEPDPRAARRRREYFLRLYDSPRFPRQVFDDFRARVTANGGIWVDELRRMLEGHGAEKENPKTDPTRR